MLRSKTGFVPRAHARGSGHHGMVDVYTLKRQPAKENEIETRYGCTWCTRSSTLITPHARSKARLQSHFNVLASARLAPRTKQENKIETRNPVFGPGVLYTSGALKCVHCLVMRDRGRTSNMCSWLQVRTFSKSLDFIFLRGPACGYVRYGQPLHNTSYM